MQLRPRFRHALLAFRQRAGNQLNRINSVNGDFFLVISMKMWRMVWTARFHVHPDNDAKKSA